MVSREADLPVNVLQYVPKTPLVQGHYFAGVKTTETRLFSKIS
jgi:hypothetical protein